MSVNIDLFSILPSTDKFKCNVSIVLYDVHSNVLKRNTYNVNESNTKISLVPNELIDEYSYYSLVIKYNNYNLLPVTKYIVVPNYDCKIEDILVNNPIDIIKSPEKIEAMLSKIKSNIINIEHYKQETKSYNENAEEILNSMVSTVSYLKNIVDSFNLIKLQVESIKNEIIIYNNNINSLINKYKEGNNESK